jgi:hypothetical protein
MKELYGDSNYQPGSMHAAPRQQDTEANRKQRKAAQLNSNVFGDNDQSDATAGWDLSNNNRLGGASNAGWNAATNL